MRTHYPARIIEYVDLTLKALVIVYHANGAAVEGLDDRNGHIQKVVGENNYFHHWLLPMNGFQDGTYYSESPVGDSS